MRVAMYYNNHDVRLEEIPVPVIGQGEMLVRIMSSGICGSDVMEWYRIKSAPRVLGHEIAGEVAEVGEGVRRFRTGDRVVVSHHVPCNTCFYCLNGNYSVCDTLRSTNFDPGGFSEYVRVPQINVDRGVFHLPDSISYDDGTFVEPLACVLGGIRRAGMRPGRSVLVVGSGVSGLIMIKALRALCAGRIIATDVNAFRLDKAKEFGADVTLLAEDVSLNVLKDINGGRPPELVIICTGVPVAITQSLRFVDRGGTMLFFAPAEPGVDIPVPLWDVWRDGITMKTTYAGTPSDIAAAIELLSGNRINVEDMITHRLGLSDAGDGFELVASAGDSIKVIIRPQE